MKLFAQTFASSLALLFSVLSMSHSNAEDVPGAAAAGRCSELPKCPTLGQVYDNTPALRHALADAFRHVRQKQPEWLTHGASSAAIPVTVEDRAYLLGRVSDANDPSRRLSVLYDLVKGSVTAQYVEQDGNVTTLGDESGSLANVVASYRDESSALFKAVNDPNAALPLRVNPGSL